MDEKSPQLRQRLSGADAAFLYLERKEIPLHIACVCTFEAAIPFEEFAATIDSKLHLLPRYRQIAVSPPFDIGYPNWEYDPHFDIRRHLIRMTVNAPGDEAALEELAGRVFSTVMNRDKPLWEVYVIEGLQGGRGALIAKVHHALADGVAGASLLRIMLDPTAEGSHAIHKPHFHPPAPAKEPSLSDAIASAIHSSLENMVAAEAGLLDLAQGLLSDRTQQGLQGLVALLPEIATPVQRLPFNKPCGSERKFCWAEFDFADVKAIRNTTGGTVNDVILTVVTRALAQYVKLHGESAKDRLLRMACPVSIRKDEQGASLGNQISFLPLTVPMDAAGPVEHLQAIARRTAIMKSVRAAELLGIAASWLGAAPPPAQALFWWGIPLIPMPAPLLNLICTNVPGSPTPLYCVGTRMLSSYPHVPTGYELGVGIAVQSYNGKMCFGLTADAVVAADVNRLRDFIGVSWAELCRAAGVPAAPRPAATQRRKPAAKAKATKPVRATVAKRAPKPVAAQSQRTQPTATPTPEPAKEPALIEQPVAAEFPPVVRATVVKRAPKPVAAQSRRTQPAATPTPEPAKEAAPIEQPVAAEFPPVVRAAVAKGAPKPVAAQSRRTQPAATPTPEPAKEAAPIEQPVAAEFPPVVRAAVAKGAPQPVAAQSRRTQPAATPTPEPAKEPAPVEQPVAAEFPPVVRAKVAKRVPKPVAAQSRQTQPAATPKPEPMKEPAPVEQPTAVEFPPVVRATVAKRAPKPVAAQSRRTQPAVPPRPEPAKEPAPVEQPTAVEFPPVVDHANIA